ncbi:MAG: DUF1398 family protein [Bacteroidetes bacterium]|nr:DUF1398 family protein [Bacteroidota bacterium]
MFTLKQIEEAHSKVKSGMDFPKYIQEIKAIGVNEFETFVKDSHTDYYDENRYKLSSRPMYENLEIENSSSASKFKYYLSIHQQGETDYFTFCKHCAETGIEKWIASLIKMTCIYYDKAGNEISIENIPQI